MVQLSQQWLNKVTKSDQDDIGVVGPSFAPELPDDIANIVYQDFCDTAAGKEIIRRKWMPAFQDVRESAQTIAMEVKSMVIDAHKAVLPGAMFRSTTSIGAQSIHSAIASQIWLGHCAEQAVEMQLCAFDKENLSHESVNTLVKLSRYDDGPVRAKKFLENLGVAFVVASRLPSMKLDGAATILASGTPLIALTLRYDRVDNFWFTLLHEIGHVKLHLSESPGSVFLDDLESVPLDDELESEANSFARDSLISRDQWRRSKASRFKTRAAVMELADKLKVHPAIVAGRLRYETRNYTIHSDMLGQDTVRDQLIEIGG